MSVAWYWPDWGSCSDSPEESCSDANCPVHGDADDDRNLAFDRGDDE